jgi:hypothetical protein
MMNSSFDEALQAVRSLPPVERRRLLEIIAEEEQAGRRGESQETARRLPQKSYELEYKWLREHRAEYAGQWVALDGDRLVSHGEDGRKVYAEAREAGVEIPYLVHIEPADAPPFGGW